MSLYLIKRAPICSCCFRCCCTLLAIMEKMEYKILGALEVIVDLESNML